jgi:putative transposase
MVMLAHKIRIFTNQEQEEYLNKACGIARFTYNNTLAEWKRLYEAGEKPSKFSMLSWLSHDLRNKFEWMKEVTLQAGRCAIIDLDQAFKKFFNGSGYPKFHKKGINDSFAIRQPEKFKVVGTKLKIEKLSSWLQMEQKLRFGVPPKHVTISKKADRWYASILVETNDYPEPTSTRKPIVGVDLGIKTLAVLSNGEVFKNHKPLRKMLLKLAKLQKMFARKVKQSRRYKIFKLRIQKLHMFIRFKRQAILHELSDYLTKNFDNIVLEDLNVSGMLKNHKLALAIADVGFSELKQQVDYKSKLRNNNVIIANRFFASSKTCSNCGVIKQDLTLSDRTYKCKDCGFIIDRDLNAAINLMNYGRHTLQGDLKRTKEPAASKSAGVDSVNFLAKNNNGETNC